MTLGFPPGPWDDEPLAPQEWKHRGIRCLMTRHPSTGNWMGYVEITGSPEEAIRLIDPACIRRPLSWRGMLAQPGRWLGFHCAHAADHVPAYAAQTEGTEYPTYAHVRAEVERLADALVTASRELEDHRSVPDQIRAVLGDDTGRIEIVRGSDGIHVGDRPRESTDAELVEDVRRVKERADRAVGAEDAPLPADSCARMMTAIEAVLDALEAKPGDGRIERMFEAVQRLTPEDLAMVDKAFDALARWNKANS